MNRMYSWKEGSSEFKKLDAEVVASELEKLREESGQLKPADVVRAARSAKSPLHSAFPWDDKKAAQIGREAIAARLIRSIRIKIVTPSRGEIDTRAFVSTRDPAAKGNRSYTSVTHAMEDEEGRAMLLRQAWMELRAWKRRYAELSELASVFDVIEQEGKEVAKAG